MKFAQFKHKDYTKEIAQVAALVGDKSLTQKELGQVATQVAKKSGITSDLEIEYFIRCCECEICFKLEIGVRVA